MQFGWPAVIATRMDKSKYAVHKGDFSSDSIRSFLTSLMSGRQTLSSIPEKLPLFSTVSTIPCSIHSSMLSMIQHRSNLEVIQIYLQVSEWDNKDSPAVNEEL